MKSWIEQQKARARELGEDLELNAEKSWRQVTSGGAAPATAGRALSPTARMRQPAPAPARPPAPHRSSALDEAGAQIGAGLRGADDALTFGLGDRVVAGVGAASDAAFHNSNLGAAWRNRMAAQRASDLYDAQHYGAARATGRIAGAGLGLLALGPTDGLLFGAARMAKAAPMVAREVGALAGGGALAGVGAQGITDARRHHRGSFGDYAGSALGGATMAIASASGRPGAAGALGGAVTSASQDALNGRPVDWGQAAESAWADGALAAPVGLGGRYISGRLSSAAKGKLGEAMGAVRTLANGDVPLPKQRLYVNGGPKYTIPDHPTLKGLYTEQKFGPYSRLSGNQRAASIQFGDRYRVDNFQPRDVGVAAAFPFGLLGPRIYDDE